MACVIYLAVINFAIALDLKRMQREHANFLHSLSRGPGRSSSTLFHVSFLFAVNCVIFRPPSSPSKKIIETKYFHYKMDTYMLKVKVISYIRARCTNTTSRTRFEIPWDYFELSTINAAAVSQSFRIKRLLISFTRIISTVFIATGNHKENQSRYTYTYYFTSKIIYDNTFLYTDIPFPPSPLSTPIAFNIYLI